LYIFIVFCDKIHNDRIKEGRLLYMSSKSFGMFLRKKRNEKKMTMMELSEITGVTQSYISQIETGKKGIPQPETLKRLAKGLEIPYSTLMVAAGYLDENEKKPSFGKIFLSIDSNIYSYLKLLIANHPFQGKIHSEIDKAIGNVLNSYNINEIGNIDFTKENVAEQIADLLSGIEDDNAKLQILKALQDITHENRLWLNEFYEDRDVVKKSDLYKLIHSENAHYKEYKLNDEDRAVITAYLDGYFTESGISSDDINVDNFAPKILSDIDIDKRKKDS